ncbi:16S rRNA (guanine(527)-N(7))-methyltransferase RsmG [Myxococcota bacterium]
MAPTILGRGWQARIELVLDQVQEETAAVFAPERLAAPIDALCSLLDLLVSWNRRVDLTAARDADELVDLYLADSVVLAKHANSMAAARNWTDVGSGAGAPALGMALLAPRVELTMVEPRAKRVAFLRTALATVNRTDWRVERARSEQLSPRSCDVALSRATVAPARWLPEGARLARQGVWVLLGRGEPPTLAGWQLKHDVRYAWPLTRTQRRAVYFVRVVD